MGTEPHISRPSVRISATRCDLELSVERLFRSQKQLIRLEQLVALGLSPSEVEKRVNRRHLHRLHRSVFAAHPPPYSPQQQYLAAVYACGGATLVSDWAAAWLIGSRETLPLLPHVSNPAGRGRRLNGLVVHQRLIDARDRTNCQGIPCTSAPRMILDCAASATILELEDLLMAADSGRPGLHGGRLKQLVAENAGQRGIRNLRALITDDPRETQSVNERRGLSICREYGVPLPDCQVRIDIAGRTFYADFLCPDLNLIVEADSWRWHGGKEANESDSDRDQLLAIAGYRVVHFTRNQIKLARAETGRRLVALTSRRFPDHPSG